ncbi:hypothetical protein SCP_0806320 [Sparassis crispa]|uniref:Uncharacterized protein n=1 Tax=Sparassis crispa TaxID=139825 RepID=A0A401GV60_9APHY|nr:hypothetical protein SCP_0806320 [Sparassis crispa]GBE86108.1 hypothetical protein SCP_0806320 [Sparassis crispa]
MTGWSRVWQLRTSSAPAVWSESQDILKMNDGGSAVGIAVAPYLTGPQPGSYSNNFALCSRVAAAPFPTSIFCGGESLRYEDMDGVVLDRLVRSTHHTPAPFGPYFNVQSWKISRLLPHTRLFGGVNPGSTLQTIFGTDALHTTRISTLEASLYAICVAPPRPPAALPHLWFVPFSSANETPFE